MNPFLQSTVAQPLNQASKSRWLSARRITLGLLLASGLVPHWALATDLNTADAQALEALKGIGPKTAQAILEERERGGPFINAEDFQERVRGMGPKKVEGLLQYGLIIEVAPRSSQ
ncbi:MAG TPA: DUF655 domain-containing protein [Candidatus Paenalcaligenes intestinipullorum]|uniref:DUF655 domain-containing protein n=1 Tax=Candidatus Paenalcaligenes intestinipullorum TaxID=2838718 RepID=A0A9D2RH65_9BURK|nr:DUF655 domain-containing protein [Candidatus Paenalcaligenes intestinipullorum]